MPVQYEDVSNMPSGKTNSTKTTTGNQPGEYLTITDSGDTYYNVAATGEGPEATGQGKPLTNRNPQRTDQTYDEVGAPAGGDSPGMTSEGQYERPDPRDIQPPNVYSSISN